MDTFDEKTTAVKSRATVPLSFRIITAASWGTSNGLNFDILDPVTVVNPTDLMLRISCNITGTYFSL
jgi:hypothetical protein